MTTPIGLAPGAPELAAGQDAKKYASTNPVVRRLLDAWTRRLRTVIGPIAETDVIVDVGVGEGLCLERFLPLGHSAIGVEYRHDKAVLAVDRLDGLSPVVADAGMLPIATASADIVTCIEVLEHLVVDEPAVAELARICRGRCIVSVPWEPWFRLGNLGRGKNIARLGNDPEHVQFFTPARLRSLLATSFASVRVVEAFPWLIAEARV
ncbi:MAG: class I SAM-dependent methyltransferase [Actinobacteria bacterium]|nr:class I SAM-dependent methyltransferase [Actinomycetota bacterium]